MKTMRIIWCMMLAVCLVACDKSAGDDISRDTAYTLALKKLKLSLGEVDIWATREKLPPNTTMNVSWFSVTSPDTESWLFFVDDVPQGNWEHSCRYAFVDMDGKVHVHEKTMGPNLDDYNMECINESDVTKYIHNLYRNHYLTYEVKDGDLRFKVCNYFTNRDTEDYSFEYRYFDDNVVYVLITEVGEWKSNDMYHTEFSFPVPDLKMGETYKFDIRVQRLGHTDGFTPYFPNFFIPMEEGTDGTIKVGQD